MKGLAYFIAVIVFIALFYTASLGVHMLIRLEFTPLSAIITSTCAMIVVLLFAEVGQRK